MSKAVGIIDEPVQSSGNDNLDINVHADSLKSFIEKTSTPITVGIQGEWGSGKTSLINSIYSSQFALLKKHKYLNIIQF